MTVRNTGDQSVTLIGISTELAMMPGIHRSATNEQGVIAMSPAGDIVIVPGETVALEPGGAHAHAASAPDAFPFDARDATWAASTTLTPGVRPAENPSHAEEERRDLHVSEPAA